MIKIFFNFIWPKVVNSVCVFSFLGKKLKRIVEAITKAGLKDSEIPFGMAKTNSGEIFERITVLAAEQ